MQWAAIVFLGIIVIVFLVYTNYTGTGQQTKEGFASLPSAKPVVAQPEHTPEPADSALIPGALPTAPYNGIAITSPNPYGDPALQPTTRTAILNVLEDLKGFIAFEAPLLSDQSDPAVQLPLARAKADFENLENEAAVLQRNPGINPSMTQEKIAEIYGNLKFLQDKARRYAIAVRPFDADKRLGAGVVEGFADTAAEVQERASVEDLTKFILRARNESQNLAASGTRDPITVARIAAIDKLMDDLNDIIVKVQRGDIPESAIPVYKKELEVAFPTLGDTDAQLPEVVQSTPLPAFVSALMPASVQQDEASRQILAHRLDSISKQLEEGLSWKVKFGVDLKYTSPRDLEREQAKAVSELGSIYSMFGLNGVDPESGAQLGAPTDDSLEMAAGGAGIMPAALPGPGGQPAEGDPRLDIFSHDPRDEGRPATFDWKARAKEIERQIERRGLKPTDFGVMPKDTAVGPDFSWRGYTRMMCTRLMATPDPGLPQTVGCPPLDWQGWRM